MSKSRSRLALLNALNIAKPAIGKGVFVPVLSHFCFTGDQVIACDDVVTIGVECDVEHKMAVPAELTLKLLGSLSSNELVIEDDKTNLVLHCGKSVLKVPYLPRESFVFKVQDWEQADEAFTVSPDFIHGIKCCLLSVGSDPTHPAQMGITIAGGDLSYLYSTDNKTMSRYLIPASEVLPRRGIILPTAFCELLVSMFKEYYEECEPVATIDGKTILVRFGELAFLQARLLISETTLDFAAVFDSPVAAPLTEFIAVPALWEEAWTRACAVVDPQHAVSKVALISTDALVIHSTSKVGDARDVLPIDNDKELAFAIDPSHVLRAVKMTEEVAFAKGSMLVSKGRFLHLISHLAAE